MRSPTTGWWTPLHRVFQRIGKLPFRQSCLSCQRARRTDLERSMEIAIGGVMEHWVVIEQAKGALMAGYGVTPDHAFAILALVSQLDGSLTVHEVAERLLTRLSYWDAGSIGPDVLDACLAQVAD